MFWEILMIQSQSKANLLSLTLLKIFMMFYKTNVFFNEKP